MPRRRDPCAVRLRRTARDHTLSVDGRPHPILDIEFDPRPGVAASSAILRSVPTSNSVIEVAGETPVVVALP